MHVCGSTLLVQLKLTPSIYSAVTRPVFPDRPVDAEFKTTLVPFITFARRPALISIERFLGKNSHSTDKERGVSWSSASNFFASNNEIWWHLQIEDAEMCISIDDWIPEKKSLYARFFHHSSKLNNYFYISRAAAFLYFDGEHWHGLMRFFALIFACLEVFLFEMIENWQITSNLRSIIW